MIAMVPAGRLWLANRQTVGMAFVLLATIARPTAAAPPEPTQGQPVLELPGDAFATGQFGPPAAQAGGAGRSFTWQSPAFATPFEFPWSGITRIRLPPAPAPPLPAGAWRADLRDGGIVIGLLEAIDAEHVTLAAPGVGKGPLKLRRDAIVRLTREGGTTRIFVPGSLGGWEGDRKAWREEAGRLAGSGGAVSLVRDVAAPARACFEIALSWDERPEFEIGLAAGQQGIADLKAGAGRRTAADAYRIETASTGELLVVRESERVAKLNVAETIAAGPGRLWLRAFVDQDTGRLALTLAKGAAGDKPVVDQTLPPVKPGANTGFGIRLRRGRLRIERLLVAPWTEQEPRLPETSGLGGADDVVESFDKARNFFVVSNAGERREVPAQDVGELGFRREEQPARPEDGVMALFHGGTLLTGRVLDIVPPSIRLDLAGVAEPVQCDLRQIAMLENVVVPTPPKPPARAGTLEGPGIRMPGCLTNAGESGIAWQPRGGLTAPALAGSKVPLRIVYKPEADVADQAATGQTGAGPAANVQIAGFNGGQVVMGGKVIIRQALNNGAVIVTPAPNGNQTPGNPPPPFPDGKSLLFLKTGDAVLCKVLGADATGVRIRTDAGAEVLVPAAAARAVELVAAAGQLVGKTKAERLLILPRSQQADPPTHMLRLAGGDYLRGKLAGLDDAVVRFEVADAVKELRRADVTRVIWLTVPGDGADAAAIAAIAAGRKPDDVPVRALLQAADGPRRLTFAADRIADDRLVGRNGVLGEVAVNLADCVSLELGPAATQLPASLPYAQWRLKPAPVPRALQAGK